MGDIMMASELLPVTSTTTKRYGALPWVDLNHTISTPGLRPYENLNSKWLCFVHPEGQRYFQMQHTHFSIVTEENVLDKDTDDSLSNCVAMIEKKITGCDVHLPQNCELFIELRFDEAPTTCAYYFVDHNRHCLFWLEATSSELLDMGMVVSDSHLDIALERHYWVHLEFFPMHIYAQIGPHLLDDLISVISHGMIDRMTSRTSTFPYTERKCGQLLQTLSLHRGKPLDGHILCLVARLWGAIYNQRFMTYYGQENAQLDRLHQTLQEDTVDRPGTQALTNLVLWGVPNYYHSKLHDLFVNEQVYVDQWQAFMTECISEWRGIFSWAFSVLIASILITMLPYASVASAMAPILAAMSSIVSGSILLLRHHGFEDATATFAAGFLRTARSSEWGFLPLSVVYSMPKALYFWSLGLMVAQFMVLVSQMVGVPWAMGGTCLITLMGYGIVYLTSLEGDLPDPLGVIPRSYWSALQDGSEEVV